MPNSDPLPSTAEFLFLRDQRIISMRFPGEMIKKFHLKSANVQKCQISGTTLGKPHGCSQFPHLQHADNKSGKYRLP